jgi:hypothetical protein
MGKLVATDSLKPHPTLESKLRPLTPEEYADLKASIAEFGQKQDIVIDAENTIIDGHHRWRIAKELGHAKVSVWPEFSLSPEKAEELGIQLNEHRRHMNTEQRRGLVAVELLRDSTRSDREIGRLKGVSHVTVARVRSELINGGQIVHHETRTGTDGVAQPSTKPPRTPTLAKDRDTGTGKAPKYDKLTNQRELREASVSTDDSAMDSSDESTDLVHVAPDGGPILPADVVKEARREYRESTDGRIRAYLVKIGGLAPFLTDDEVQGFATGLTPGELMTFRSHHALLSRFIEAAGKEKIRVVR